MAFQRLAQASSLAALAGALVAGSAHAQATGTVEVGPFLQFTRADAAWDVKNGFGGGGRIGLFVTPRWELEGTASFGTFNNKGIRGTGTSTMQTFEGQINYHFPFGFGGIRHQLLLEAGAGGERFAGHTDFSVPLGGGLRVFFHDNVALRLDGIVDYVENPTAATFGFPPTPGVNPRAARSTNVEIRAGLSFLLGKGAPSNKPVPAPVVESRPTPPPPRTEPTPPPARVEPAPPRENTDSIARVNNAREALLAKVLFDFDKSDLREDQRAILDAKLPVLRANPGVRIRIEGNADERGSDEYNMALDMRRAQIARKYLVDHGIDAARIDIISNGEERPTCQGHDESCWSQNRRDEFVIVAGGDRLVAP